ncbi:MAG TPA: LuxR C-terminal-related transcriptional regulator [Candidatus Dormibacteraeota bacterium]
MARPRPHIGNLPAETTSFVGRRRELADLKRRLTSARLVSLVGPGGVGKTRLALRTAGDLARGFKDGAWLVELADLSDPALVAEAFLAAHDVRHQSASEPLDVLLGHVAGKHALLVVDNCEHVLDAVGVVVNAVIRSSKGIRVLVTSREPLGIGGENVVPVSPLQLPAAGGRDELNQLKLNEAVMLFVERSVAASGRFELTSFNSRAVSELCRRLDGLPLAIELAAVRTRSLSVDQIVERLSDRFRLLTGGSRAALPRQQTLRTAIDWSHDLLSADEQILLRRVGIFAGRFSLEDAEAVCTDGDLQRAAALELISSLVNKSLLVRDDGAAFAGYRLHETMREYARTKLEAGREGEMLADRCVDHCLRTCRRSATDGSHLPEWLALIEFELENARWAFRRCLGKGDAPRAIDLAVSLGWYWITRATAEGARWLDEVVAMGGGTTQARAWVYLLRGYLAVLQGSPAAAVPALERAAAAARESNQPVVESSALSLAAIADNLAGDRRSAVLRLEAAEAIIRGGGDLGARLTFFQSRSLNAFFAGDLNEARSAALEGVQISRETGAATTQALMLVNLGFAALMSDDIGESKTRFEEALAVAREVDDRITQYYALIGLACVTVRLRPAKEAAQLMGAAEGMRSETGVLLNPIFARAIADAEKALVGNLGSQRLEAQMKAGRAMTRDSAIALAMGDAVAPAPPEGDVLGKRQAEVARLVAEGLSNKQIGARLFISEYTVDSHVRTILNKLGFNSRSQIAAWAAEDYRASG